VPVSRFAAQYAFAASLIRFRPAADIPCFFARGAAGPRRTLARLAHDLLESFAERRLGG
jgi:hypothetical protein